MSDTGKKQFTANQSIYQLQDKDCSGWYWVVFGLVSILGLEITRGATIHWKRGGPRRGRFGSIYDTVFLHFLFGHSVHPVLFSAAYEKRRR